MGDSDDRKQGVGTYHKPLNTIRPQLVHPKTRKEMKDVRQSPNSGARIAITSVRQQLQDPGLWDQTQGPRQHQKSFDKCKRLV